MSATDDFVCAVLDDNMGGYQFDLSAIFVDDGLSDSDNLKTSIKN